MDIQILNETNVISRNFIEKSMAMRCSSYLSQVKAKLLTDTIFEIDNKKKVLFTTNANLKKEIQERKIIEEKLIAATCEVEDAMIVKDKFVALVSHGLRNKITGIMGTLQLMELNEAFHDELLPQYSQCLKACIDMNLLISDILNLSRIKGGEILPDINCVDFHDLVEDVFLTFAETATKKGVILDNQLPLDQCIFADKKLIGQVINNLISNSIKFCRNEDAVTVSLKVTDKIIIVVKDTGTGIAQDRFEDIFRYETFSSTTGTDGEKGTGFGLPLSRDIVEAHGGHLWLESSEKTGTKFYIEIPDLT